MANIVLRSPQYKSFTSHANANSALMTITIDGTLRYTIVKECSGSQVVGFEIAELCRDYINIAYSATPLSPTISIVIALSSHASTDGSGSALNSAAFADTGYDGYGTFMEGSSPTVVKSAPTWLISFDPDSTSVNERFYVFIPTGYQGYVPLIKSNGTAEYYKFGSTDTEATGTNAGIKLNIVRVNCTKYNFGNKVRFVNKYGVIQELWFFLKDTETINKKSETYKRSIITEDGRYVTSNHMVTPFNTTANQTMTLSSGYYPEWCNQWFEELLLSEQIWISNDSQTNPNSDVVRPVTIKTSQFRKKTKLNDRLIEYTMEFELAADYINNVR